MSKNHVKMLKNLDKVLLDDAGETPAEVRQRLEAEGVDVKGLVARVKAAAGEASAPRDSSGVACDRQGVHTG